MSANDLVSAVVEQLGGPRTGTGGGGHTLQNLDAPLSPAQGRSLMRPDQQKKRRDNPATGDAQKDNQRKKRREEVVEDEEVESEGLNSDDFPEEDRPEMFRDNKKFNRLTYETAAKICWEYKQLRDQKEMKVILHNSY